MMDKKKLVASAAAAGILALGAGGVAYATGGDSSEQVTGPGAEKAKSAAIEAVGGGSVTEVEREDGYDGGVFEVEVKLDNGNQVEVHLDRDLNVLGREADDDGPNDADGPNDD
jgi:uncharacterized membrane protein YkoI